MRKSVLVFIEEVEFNKANKKLLVMIDINRFKAKKTLLKGSHMRLLDIDIHL